MSSTTVRKQAPRLPQPVGRYWKGKAPKGANVHVESDSEAEDEQLEHPELEDGDVAIKTLGDEEQERGSGEEDEEEEEEGMTIIKRQQQMGEVKKVGVSVKTMNVALKDVNISKDGKVIVAGREESGRTVIEAVEESEEEEGSEEEQKPAVKAESEEESSEYESSSDEEEEKPKLQFRPVFVPKRARATIAEREALAQDTEEAQKKKEEEAEARKKQSHDMVAETIKRELAEKETEETFPDVDDTDGQDPEVEFEAWKLRELARIKRDKEAEVERELEREEIERRRAMPEEQRLKEDMENAQKSRNDKPKGKQKFLQKYYHKGAFHQDYDILKRDYTEATESTMDVSLLPKVMQVRNFGKRSRTKYTHLLDQDTTAGNGGFGGSGSVKSGGTNLDGGGGCFLCGGPHLKKDCPQNAAAGPLTARGANAQGTQTKQWGAPPGASKGPGSWRDREGGQSFRDRRYKDRDDRDDERRSRYYGGSDWPQDRRYTQNRDRDSYGDRPRDTSPSRRYESYDRYGRSGSSWPQSRSRSPRRTDRYTKERRRSREISGDDEHRARDKRRRVD